MTRLRPPSSVVGNLLIESFLGGPAPLLREGSIIPRQAGAKRRGLAR